MKKILFFICSILGLLFFSANLAVAGEVLIHGSISRGQEDSMAYQLGVTQVYDPWYSSEAFDLTPSLGITGHAWVPDHGDTIWGATIPLGLRFRMNTSAGFRPYLSGIIGPTVISDDDLDDRDLGSRALIMTGGNLGFDFGDSLQHRIEGQYRHYSTWGITSTDPGYDTYGLSYGYSF